MKFKQIKVFFLLLLIFLNILGLGQLLFNSSNTIEFKNNQRILINNSVIFLNVTVVSDDETHWNNEGNGAPEMTIDSNGKIHVIWTDDTNGIWGTDREIMYASSTDGITWSNATVISDGYGGVYWNDGYCTQSDITVDQSGTIHVVWGDWTNGAWGTDVEIMYVSNNGTGWTNVTVISDDYTHWNNGGSGDPKIEIDLSGNIHVVWTDATIGPWGGGTSDYEIMHVSSTDGITWSNATIISDDLSLWNNANSLFPEFTIDVVGDLHVVWHDETIGLWGGGATDDEIMYISSADGITWSNATIISDGYNGTYWNNADSTEPCIKTDNGGIIHVVWDDDTEGIWGTDPEVMYVSSVDGITWSNATVISDGYNGTYWKNSVSRSCDLDIDNFGNLHVVFSDSIDMFGPYAIGYVYYTKDFGWSNMSVISDGYNNYYWNNDESVLPSVAIDNSNIVNVVWSDWTDGPWGTDPEVLYTKVFPDNVALILDHPDDIIYEEGMTGNSINWTAIDSHPNNYTIKRDGIVVDNGTWTSDIPINISIDGLPIDTYVYIIEVFDLFGNNASDSVNVSVWQLADPIIHLPPDFSYKEGETRNFINWFATDLHPTTYSITRNGTNVETGTWESGILKTINIDGLSIGDYVFTFEVFDQLGQDSSDTITVTVLPKEKPSIPFGNSWILISIISILGLAVYVKKKKL